MSPRLRRDISTSDTHDGLVLLDEKSGRYWQLNHTGAHVLHALQDGMSPDAIAVDLTNRYAVAADDAHADVAAVIAQLTAAKLLAAP